MRYIGEASLSMQLTEMCNKNAILVSIEVTPSLGEEDGNKLLKRVKAMDMYYPLQFCAITWHMRNNPQNVCDYTTGMKRAVQFQRLKIPILFHLAVGNLSKKTVLSILQKVKSINIQNIFALRGDSMRLSQDFPYAVNLVRFIRLHMPDNFTICVAGYPDGHPFATSYYEDLVHLKEKVDAGANFIITQIVIDAKTVIKFAQDCKAIGIKEPICAGIMPIQDYHSFQHISKLCHLRIPQHISNILESIKNNDETVKLFGIFHAVNTVKEILNSGCLNGLHFFTMNRTPGLIDILQQTNLITAFPSKSLCFTLEEETNRN